MCEKNNRLYENYTNYIYDVEADVAGANIKNYYILFNPSLHYWMYLDEISHEIYLILKEVQTIDAVREYIVNKYNISEEVFNTDALPIIEHLIDKKFLTTEKTEAEASWMRKPVDNNDIERYPFNDLYISLSDICNLNCIYCFNREDRKQRVMNNENSGLSTEKIIEIMNEYKELGGIGVVFTGGEPTLNQDFLLLCSKAKEIGLQTRFITNGTRLGELDLDQLFKYIDTFGLSLDSIEQEEINRLWGTSNVVLESSILKNLKKINEWAKEHRKISITMQPIVTALNIHSLKKLVTYIKQELDHCEVDWMITQYDSIQNEEVDNLLKVNHQEYVSCVVDSLKSISNEEDFSSKEEYEKHLNKINLYAITNSGKLIPAPEPKVMTCAPSFFIVNNGDIYPCQGFEKKEYLLGNVWKMSLKEAFSQLPFMQVREKIVKNNSEICRNCELRFVCESKCLECNNNCCNDPSRCKERVIRRLYLLTQL